MTKALFERARPWDTWDSCNQGIIAAIETELDTLIEGGADEQI